MATDFPIEKTKSKQGFAGKNKLLRRFKKSVRIAVTAVRYRLYKLSHPGATYGEFYGWFNSRYLASGKRHMSLQTVETVAAGNHQRAFSAKSIALTNEIYGLLLEHGLERDHTCVDYGCGSLRIGEKLIDFLEPGRYIGMDVVDTFFNAGLNRIDSALVAAKQPRTMVIGDDTLRPFKDNPPDFLFSFAVIQHVPPAELDKFLDRFASLIGPKTKVVLFYRDGKRVSQYHETSWRYPETMLSDALRARRPGVSIVNYDDEWTKIAHTKNAYSYLVLNS